MIFYQINPASVISTFWPLVSVLFGSAIPTFCSIFVELFFILVFVAFFGFLKSHHEDNTIRMLSTFTVLPVKTPKNEILCVCFIFKNIVHS